MVRNPAASSMSIAPAPVTLVATAGIAVQGRVPCALTFQALAVEGEDALLTGMTRSLQRRVRGLNVPAELPEPRGPSVQKDAA